MSLDKVLQLAGQAGAQPAPDGDPAGELVAAALSVLAELQVRLAAGDDSDGGSGHDGHSTYKRLIAKGMNASMAAKMCAKADDKVATTQLCKGAIIALSALDATAGDWVELTAFDPLVVPLSDGDAKKAPYGDVEYADPGYQDDGKKRYPLDAKHIHAAIAYFSKAKNRAQYSATQVKSMWGKIKSAARKHGVDMSDDTATATAIVDNIVELASKGKAVVIGDGGVAMNHAPFTGIHAHTHHQTAAHAHPHQHFGDNDHSGGSQHRAGSAPSNTGW